MIRHKQRILSVSQLSSLVPASPLLLGSKLPHIHPLTSIPPRQAVAASANHAGKEAERFISEAIVVGIGGLILSEPLLSRYKNVA
jgi:hypothetical protein